MSEIILTDLPTETLADMAAEKAELVEQHGRKTVQAAIDCGRYLIEIKSRLGHGEWLPWLEENWRLHQAWASQFMKMANYARAHNLEQAGSIREALRMIGEVEEAAGTKRTRKPAATTPAPDIEVIDNRPPKPAPQPARAMFDESDDLPQLPKTNTHHTSANRRTPDARETDRIGIVPPDDPRTYHDGNWYEWNEPLNRMISVSEDDILAEADRIRQWRRGLVVAEPVKDTTPVVEPVKQSVSNKRFTPPTADEVASYSDEINAGVDGQQFVDFYESKGWMIGKNKMKDWKAAVRTWKRSENQRGSKITTAVRSNRNWDEEIPEWKPTE
jgi:hypothetical protein